MYSRKRGWRWSHRWQDEKGFSSLLTGLLANTQDDERQNGHPHNYQGLTLKCLMEAQQHQVLAGQSGNRRGPASKDFTPGWLLRVIQNH